MFYLKKKLWYFYYHLKKLFTFSDIWITLKFEKCEAFLKNDKVTKKT